MNWANTLLKAPPVKKKRMIQFKNALIDQELGEEIGTIQKQYTKWKCSMEMRLCNILWNTLRAFM